MFKKSLLTLVIALTLMSGVSKAHAYSLEDAMADIASLKTQITQLKDQLSAAVITTKASSAVTAVPITTEPVVSTEKTVTFSSSANILPNQKGGDVILLQQALKDKGYYKGEVTGNFGAVTEKAVRAFQTANKIASTGVVGPTTKSLLTTPTGNTCAPTAAFLPTSSTPSQYIASANGTGQSQLVYKITIPSSCHSIKITELKLSNTGTPGVITSATIGSVTVPFTATNTAYFAGLNLTVPNTTAGLSLNVTLTYPVVGLAGVPSGTVSSKVKLTYLKYTNMTTGIASSVNTNTALSPNMMLVGSKPVLTSLMGPSYGILVNGLNEIAKISVTADTQGAIKINSIPLYISTQNYGPSLSIPLPIVGNQIIVKDINGNIIPTTSTVTTIGAPVFGFGLNQGYSKAVINFTNPVTISGSATDYFTIFAPITSSVIGSNVCARFEIPPSSQFSWTDVAGSNNIPFTLANTIYYYNTSYQGCTGLYNN
jgi:peptidoglycan hydrolase-like protein with peptidoglycan-binding domain